MTSGDRWGSSRRGRQSVSGLVVKMNRKIDPVCFKDSRAEHINSKKELLAVIHVPFMLPLSSTCFSYERREGTKIWVLQKHKR